MIRSDANLSPEAKALGWAVLTAAATTLATGLVTWAIDEVKAANKARREKGDQKP